MLRRYGTIALLEDGLDYEPDDPYKLPFQGRKDGKDTTRAKSTVKEDHHQVGDNVRTPMGDGEVVDIKNYGTSQEIYKVKIGTDIHSLKPIFLRK